MPARAPEAGGDGMEAIVGEILKSIKNGYFYF